MVEHTRVMRTVIALRTPDAALQRVPNTVRQSIADVIEEQEHKIDAYGVALMMIRAGAADPERIASRALGGFADVPNVVGTGKE